MKVPSFIFAFVFLTLFLLFTLITPYTDRLSLVGGSLLFIQIRDTQPEWSRGLSGRTDLCKYCGMLFIFPVASERGFWMKDMLFSIDMVWLKGGSIVHIEENVSHKTPEKVYKPPVFVDAVLELPSGGAARRSLDIGDTIRF